MTYGESKPFRSVSAIVRACVLQLTQSVLIGSPETSFIISFYLSTVGSLKMYQQRHAGQGRRAEGFTCFASKSSESLSFAAPLAPMGAPSPSFDLLSRLRVGRITCAFLVAG